MSRESRASVERAKRLAAKMVVHTDEPEDHSLHRLVGLLVMAVNEADPPECDTPARCMLGHGPHCRSRRWMSLVAVVNAEWAKQPNQKLSHGGTNE